MLQTVKEEMKRYTKKHGREKCLVSLPQNPQQLRANAATSNLFAAAYGNEGPVPCPFTGMDVKMMLDLIPMRMNKMSLATAQHVVSGSGDMMHSVGGIVTEIFRAIGSGNLNAGLQGDALPGLRIHPHCVRQGSATAVGAEAALLLERGNGATGVPAIADAAQGETAAAARALAVEHEAAAEARALAAEHEAAAAPGNAKQTHKSPAEAAQILLEGLQKKKQMKRPAAAPACLENSSSAKRPKMPTNAKITYKIGSIESRDSKQIFRVFIPAPVKVDSTRPARKYGSYYSNCLR